MLVVIKDNQTNKTINVYKGFKIEGDKVVSESNGKSYQIPENCSAVQYGAIIEYKNVLMQEFEKKKEQAAKNKWSTRVVVKTVYYGVQEDLFFTDVSKWEWTHEFIDDKLSNRQINYFKIFEIDFIEPSRESNIVSYYYDDLFTSYFPEANSNAKSIKDSETFHKQFIHDSYSSVITNVQSDLYKMFFNTLSNSRTSKLKGYLVHPNFNFSQIHAIDKSLNNKVTLIQGPPGTGKSATLLHIIVSAVLNNKTVLLTANTNKAVDNIIKSLEDMQLSKFWLRLGRPESIIEEVEKSHETTRELRVKYDKEIDNVYKDALRFASLREVKNDLHKQKLNLSFLLNGLENTFEKNFNSFDDIKEVEKLIDSFVKAHSFNIYPIYKKVSFAAEWKLKNVKKLAIKILTRLYADPRINESIEQVKNLEDLKRVANGIKEKVREDLQYVKYQLELRMQVASLSEKIDHMEQEVKDIDFDAELNKLINNNSYFWNVRTMLNEKLRSNDGKRHKYLRDLASISTQYSPLEKAYQIKKFINNSFYKKDEKKEFLNLFPVMVCTNKSVASLPNNKFDYVIIEEASQSDIQSSLPLLSMGDKLILCGDSKQLAPIYTYASKKGKALPEEVEKMDSELRAQYKVPKLYSVVNNSIFKIFENLLYPDSSQLLDEHYRCHPHIINYSNRVFYKNKLNVKTSDSGEIGIRLIESSGKYVLKKGKNVNEDEIKLIKEDIEAKGFAKEEVAIITPFKDQVEALKEAFKEYFTSALVNENIGTVETFQGKEFEHVYFSTVKTSGSSQLGAEYLTKNELVNVAVSRAKKEFILVSCVSELMKHPSLINKPIGRLIKYIESKEYEQLSNDSATVFELLNKPYFNDDIEITIDNFDKHLTNAKSKGMIPLFNLRARDVYKGTEGNWGEVIDVAYVDRIGQAKVVFNKGIEKKVETQVMTKSEFMFMDSILQVIPKDTFVFANIALSKVINLDSINASAALIEKVRFFHFDYLVCKIKDNKIYAQFVIELDGESHNDVTQKERDRRKDKVCELAGLELIRVLSV